MALQEKSISLASWSLHGSKHAHVQDISNMSLMGPKTHCLKRVIDTICALDHQITSCNKRELILDCYLQYHNSKLNVCSLCTLTFCSIVHSKSSKDGLLSASSRQHPHTTSLSLPSCILSSEGQWPLPTCQIWECGSTPLNG